MADPSPTICVMGEGAPFDPHAAVSAHPFALVVLAKPDATAASDRSAVLTAILLSKPEKP